MQFHLNGFRTGNPQISEPSEQYNTSSNSDSLPNEVDVLVIGCGPAGLTLAAQLAAFPDIKTQIVDQKSGPLLLGQADGIACRTMEMFEAFGFSERVLKEAYWVNETTFWKPNDTSKDKVVRHGRIQDVEDGLSVFPHVILNACMISTSRSCAIRRTGWSRITAAACSACPSTQQPAPLAARRPTP